jgi:hypothetical protein
MLNGFDAFDVMFVIAGLVGHHLTQNFGGVLNVCRHFLKELKVLLFFGY